MPHAVLTRSLSCFGGRRPQILAYAFPDREEACRVVSRIAHSYPDHGYNPASQVYWFNDDEGLHEIWVSAQR